jgi:hypothetical protein
VPAVEDERLAAAVRSRHDLAQHERVVAGGLDSALAEGSSVESGRRLLKVLQSSYLSFLFRRRIKCSTTG